MSSTRVIVIGAGWSGLAAARTYLQVNPSISLTILDDDDSVGGVWSSSRIYPGLIANSPTGLYEFSDLSMRAPGDTSFKPIPAPTVQSYLHQYAEKHGLLPLIKFHSHVTQAERKDGGWEVTTRKGDVLQCDKLVVATGLYSKPRWPDIPQDDSFKGVVMHSKSLGQEHQRLTADEVSTVVVVGGCKSALEVAGICVAAGKQVHWVIRPNEHGVPLVIVAPDAKPNPVATNNRRIFNIWNPSIFDTSSFWYEFLHSGRWRLGCLICSLWWPLVSWAFLFAAGYHKSENGAKIRPKDRNLFRALHHISLVFNTNPVIAELHSGKRLTVHRACPTRLTASGMELDNGTTIPADAVLYATGWQPTIDFFSLADALDLGIPVPVSAVPPSTATHWSTFESTADTHLATILPHLSSPPLPQEPARTTPFRQYRCVLSPRLLARRDRSVAFVGLVSNPQTTVCSELTALFAIAYLEDLLPTSALPSEAAMEVDVARVNAWRRRRYGARDEPEIILEIQQFFDILLRDLGLRAHRRSTPGWLGWWSDWLGVYEPRDYRGAVEEFLASVREEAEGKENRGTKLAAGEKKSI